MFVVPIAFARACIALAFVPLSGGSGVTVGNTLVTLILCCRFICAVVVHGCVLGLPVLCVLSLSNVGEYRTCEKPDMYAGTRSSSPRDESVSRARFSVVVVTAGTAVCCSRRMKSLSRSMNAVRVVRLIVVVIDFVLGGESRSPAALSELPTISLKRAKMPCPCTPASVITEASALIP